MLSYRSILKQTLKKLTSTNKEMKDIYEIAFSNESNIAYERLVNFDIERVSYRTLKAKIQNFASYLETYYPSEKNEFIAIDLPNGPSYLISFWACLMVGYTPYLVNSYYPLNLRLEILSKLNIKKVISSSDEYENLININLEELDNMSNMVPPKFNHWSNTFAISSSLTGMKAKIVIYDGSSIANLILNSDSITKENPWFMKDYKKSIKVAAILPFFHIYGIMVSYLWFAFFGRTIVFFNDLSSNTIRTTIIRHGITHIFAPPILFNKLYNSIKNELDRRGKKTIKKFNKAINIIERIGNISPNLSLRLSRILLRQVRISSFGNSPKFMITGGSYIDNDVLKLINGIGYPLFNGYGTTETSINSLNLSLKFSKRINGSVGKPFSSVEFNINEEGCLIISGTSLAKKIIYLDGKNENVKDFMTNDVVIKKNNEYFIQGRKDDSFISESGETISPDIIEQELNLSIAKACSVLELDGELTLVIQYDKCISQISIKNDLNLIRQQLSKIKYGSNIKKIRFTFDELANQNAIKISRIQLRKAIEKGNVNLHSVFDFAKEVDFISEDDEIMVRIKLLFSENLQNNSKIMQNSDYFLDLGGDSLGYISLVVSIEKTFDLSIDFTEDNSLRTPYDFYKRIIEKI